MNALLTIEVLKAIARFAGDGGACFDSEETRTLLRRIHEYLSFSGTKGTLKKWNICAFEGCFTLPSDMEIPLKYIDNGKIGKVWDKWFEFAGQASSYECSTGALGMFEDPNPYFTVYDLPPEGAHVLVIPYGDESSDAHVIVKGLYNDTQQEVRTQFNGVDYVGEYIEANRNEPHYSETRFSPVLTGVVKSITKHPVRLDWYHPETMMRGMLCDLPPKSEVTIFKRIRLKDNRCSGFHNLTILGRTRLKDFYEDNDILPFDSIDLYINTAQMINLRGRVDPQNAVALENNVQQMISRQNEYSRTTTSQSAISKVTLPRNRQMIRIRRYY